MKYCFMPVGQGCCIGDIELGPGLFVTYDARIAHTFRNSPMNGKWFYEVPDIEEIKKNESKVPEGIPEGAPVPIAPVGVATDLEAEEKAVQDNIDALAEDIQRDLDIEQAKIDANRIISKHKNADARLNASQKKLDAKQAALDAGDLDALENPPVKRRGRPKKAANK